MKVFFALTLMLSLLAFGNQSHAASYGRAAESLTIVTAGGQTHKFKVEQALNPQEQAKGLMFRTHMDDDAGMLFVFKDVEERGFWMRNTLIPLDIIFIKSDGTINHIHDSAKPKDETPIPSKGKVQYVLEINGGTAKKLGIRPGDKVRHIFIGK
ncbi:MAG: DUF192 domain-containing protein [Micavibrio aeruginosavorus]|uniref:DUF192 domain-containing protein n=1 Tax=Micavibrio aeruginosavorus TaxID=349221 RepID=A0A2W4ZKT6_9BACT|nr:MAG: DUF192 domain-containing protein [Micavibrio aeruginosavorus]